MGFEQVLLADVKIEKMPPIPVATYVFQLQPGAQYRINEKKGNLQELNVRFDVVGGELAGRVAWASYPDPTAKDKNGKSMAWSAQALKKLELALGTDSLPGEDPATYLNRVATSAHNRITADIIPGRNYKDNTTGADKTTDPSFGIFTVAPAA